MLPCVGTNLSKLNCLIANIAPLSAFARTEVFFPTSQQPLFAFIVERRRFYLILHRYTFVLKDMFELINQVSSIGPQAPRPFHGISHQLKTFGRSKARQSPSDDARLEFIQS